MELINTKNNKSIAPFNGEKYNIWKARVRALIDESIIDENALEIVDKESRPDNISAEDWQIWNKVAKGIIIRSLGDSVVSYATNNPSISAYGILKNLDEIYSRKSMATELSLEMKLQSLKYNESIPLANHFMTFDDMIVEMEAASGDRLKETNKIARLLSTLPKSYGPLVVAIQTLNDNDLNLAFVKTRLLDHEVQIKSEQKDTSAKIMHINVQNNKKFKINKNNKRGNFQSKSKVNFKQNFKCHYCGKKGHFKNDCFFFKQQNKHHNKNYNKENVSEKTVQSVNATEVQGFAFMMNSQIKKQSDTFILDSGASDHIINNENLFENYKSLNPPLKISVAKNETFINATKIGTVKLINENQVPIILENALYCRDVPHNLVSVRKMQQAGMTVEFNQEGVMISKNGQVILSCTNAAGLPIINLMLESKMFLTNKCDDRFGIWHQRLGHISNDKFLEISRNNLFSDSDLLKGIELSEGICEACLSGKQTRLKYQKEKNKEHIKRPLYIIHSDVCGPITPSTVDGKNYFVIFIDQFTHYCVTYLITRKSEVFEMFKDFVAKSEAHFNVKIVHLYSDNGGEYLSSDMKNFCVEKGISYHLTVPHTPQLNGVSERMIRYITEKARAMIHGAQMDKMFWGEAVLTATYLINRSPSKAIKNKNCTPYELWHGKKPEVKYLKIFGSTIYIHNKTRKGKFDTNSWKGIMVGYVPNGYKVWDVESSKFITARDVVIDEKEFLVTRPVVKSTGVKVDNFEQSKISNERELEGIHDNVQSKISNERELENIGNVLDKSKISNVGELENINVNDSYGKIDTGYERIKETEGNATSDASDLSKNRRCACEYKNEQENDNELRRSKRIKKMQHVNYNEDDMTDCLMNAQIFLDDIPSSYEEIKIRNDRSNWEKAVNDELDSQIKNKTWCLVDRPNDKNIIDCKWIFTVKTDEMGNPIRYKARLVARGFTQEYPTDYGETFAPVARITSLRFILAFANQFKLHVHQMDVKTAFLNGVLQEEIYMKVPQGLTCDDNKVCRLNKAIYGLKQAARCWYEVFEKVLKDVGFKNSAVDHCIYMFDKGAIDKNIYVLLYVDDVIISTASLETMINFKKFLSNKFQMTDLNEIKFFIGIKIERRNNKLYLSQSAYTQKVLRKFNMQECKPVSTPLPSKLNFEALNSEDSCDAPCRNLIGCLMYLMLCTRPDLSTAVNMMSRYSNKNNKELWQCLKRILRYIKGTIDLKLEYEKGNYENFLIGYVDSDWGGGDYTDIKSTTGFLFKVFEKCTICWNTRKQESVAASSTEAEYMALFEAVREALWLKSLCETLNLKIEKEIIIYEDNQGCISIANNPVCHKRSKHINIKYHFTREQIETKCIKIEYICTENQLADILTKPLSNVKFMELRNKIGLKLKE